MPGAAIVIVNYNGRELLGPCIEAALGQTQAPCSVRVIDNASVDGSADWVAARYGAAVDLVRNPVNTGFGAAANLGIRRSPEADYVLILNPDVRLDPEYAARLVQALENDPKAGSATGKLLRGDGKTIDSTGLFVARTLLARDRAAGKPDTGRFDTPGPVFAACGAAAMYRRGMIAQVSGPEGFFDESFFLYGEDADVGWRAQRLGWRCLYVPQARAIHLRGGTRGARKLADQTFEIQYYTFRNRYIMMLTNMPVRQWLEFLPVLLPTEVFVLLYMAFRHPRLLKIFKNLYGMRGALRARRRRRLSAPDTGGMSGWFPVRIE